MSVVFGAIDRATEITFEKLKDHYGLPRNRGRNPSIKNENVWDYARVVNSQGFEKGLDAFLEDYITMGKKGVVMYLDSDTSRKIKLDIGERVNALTPLQGLKLFNHLKDKFVFPPTGEGHVFDFKDTSFLLQRIFNVSLQAVVDTYNNAIDVANDELNPDATRFTPFNVNHFYTGDKYKKAFAMDKKPILRML